MSIPITDFVCSNRLSSLPNELGRLKHVWNLQLANMNIPDLPVSQCSRENPAAKVILPILRAKLRRCVPFNRMKLMVVGLQGTGIENFFFPLPSDMVLSWMSSDAVH